MSLADPRALADFSDRLKISTTVFRPQLYQQVDGVASGDLLVQDMASPLWMADIAVDWEFYPNARQIDAIVNSLAPPRQFYLTNYAALYPAADPTGSILGVHAPVIHSIGTDNRSISLSALPAGYVLTPGDCFHVDFGSDPVRRGFFQISEATVANGGGITPEFEVVPQIWPGMNTGEAVQLLKPACKMMFVPGTGTPQTFRGSLRADGLVFTAVQKL